MPVDSVLGEFILKALLVRQAALRSARNAFLLAGASLLIGVLPPAYGQLNNGDFAYTANCESASISAFAVNSSTGALTPINGSPYYLPPVSCPISVTADPKGRFLYVANFYVIDQATGALTHTISAFQIDPVTGALTHVPASDAPVGSVSYPRWVAINAAGTRLYVANDGYNAIAAFSIAQATGALTQLSSSPYPSDVSPHQIVLHPSGKFAYTPNRGASSLTGYAVNPDDGSLSPLPGTPFQTGGSEPVAVAITPDGKYAYVSNRGSDTVSAFSIDGQTGVPALLPSSPFPSGTAPWYSISDPLGMFLFVPNSGVVAGISTPERSSIEMYTVAGSGVISQVADSPFPTGVEPLSVNVSPDGRFVYVMAHASSEVYGFSVNRSAGILSPIPGSPWPTVAGPVTIALVTVHYQFSGFFSPIDNNGVLNKANAGQTIPIKWRLTDAAGIPIDDPASFSSVTSVASDCSAPTGSDEIEEYVGNSGLQYLGDGNWKFNWKTPKSYAGQCRIMRLNLTDQGGITSTRTAKFQFK